MSWRLIGHITGAMLCSFGAALHLSGGNVPFGIAVLLIGLVNASLAVVFARRDRRDPICLRCGGVPDIRAVQTDTETNGWICVECIKLLVPKEYARVMAQTGKPLPHCGDCGAPCPTDLGSDDPWFDAHEDGLCLEKAATA